MSCNRVPVLLLGQCFKTCETLSALGGVTYRPAIACGDVAIVIQKVLDIFVLADTVVHRTRVLAHFGVWKKMISYHWLLYQYSNGVLVLSCGNSTSSGMTSVVVGDAVELVEGESKLVGKASVEHVLLCGEGALSV